MEDMDQTAGVEASESGATPAPTLKAYYLSDEDERAEVWFCKRKPSVHDLEDEGFSICERSPNFDTYSPGPVPPLVLIDSGWWMECWGCGCRIDGSLEVENIEGSIRALAPVECGRAIYCTEQCRQDKVRDDEDRALAMYWVASDLTSRLLRAIPGVTLEQGTHVYVARQDGVYVGQQALIRFTFPGCKIGSASYRFDRPGENPKVWICAGDREAWDLWRGHEAAPDSPSNVSPGRDQ